MGVFLASIGKCRYFSPDLRTGTSEGGQWREKGSAMYSGRDQLSPVSTRQMAAPGVEPGALVIQGMQLGGIRHVLGIFRAHAEREEQYRSFYFHYL